MIDWTALMGLIAMAPPEGGEGGGALGSLLLPMVAVFFVFYLLIMRPEKRKKEERERMLGALERGDEVVTAGGILGKITAITDATVTLEVAPGVKIKFSRQHISGPANPENKAAVDKGKENGKKGKDKNK